MPPDSGTTMPQIDGAQHLLGDRTETELDGNTPKD
jgi:hypothetical protein